MSVCSIARPLKPVLRARVGLFCIGHFHYWEQFQGLRERLLDYNAGIGRAVSAWGEVHNFGMVDDLESGQRCGEFLNARQVDLIFCYSSTYAFSSVVMPVFQICKAPIVILNLQPAAQMNYDKTGTGEWLAHCGACPVPELANALNRFRMEYSVVSGLLGCDVSHPQSLADEATSHLPDALHAWREIEEWVMAATVRRTLSRGRMGMLGHTYPGMLDMYSDFSMVQAQTGMVVETLEMCDLQKQEQAVTAAEVADKRAEIDGLFEICGDDSAEPEAGKPTAGQMDAACRTAVALEKMALHFDLDALAYYYRGLDGNAYQRLQESLIVGNSLLTARGIPCAGEGDMKTALAMKICDICGVGGSFCEIVAADYVSQTMILGHDGPFHVGIADRKPLLRGMGVYHGKWGNGVSVEARVKAGPVTCLGVTQRCDGRLGMIVNQGEATTQKALKIGNTMTHVKFEKNPAEFMDQWFALAPTHHFAMSIGHNAGLFRKIARMLGLSFDTVCL